MNSTMLLLPFVCLGVYLLLEAADWGLSLAAPYVGRNEEEDKAVLGLLKPGWDGNELWLLLGLLSLSAADPSLVASTQGMVLGGMAVIGAVLRLAGCFGKEMFGKRALTRLVSSFSVFCLFMMSFTGISFLNEGESMVSLFGVLFAVWLVLEMFHMGSLYGAVKVVNPLGERFRAASLVSGVLGLVFFLITIGLLYVQVGNIYQYGTLLWGVLAAGAVVAFLVSFVLTRTRHAGAGLLFGYISCALALSVYLSAGASAIAVHHHLDGDLLSQFMDSTQGMALLGGAVVLSAVAFVWKLCRKKEEYVWDDHI